MTSFGSESSSSLVSGVVAAPTVMTYERETRRASRSRSTTLACAIWVAFLAQAWNSILGTSTIAFIGSYNLTVAEPALAAGVVALALGWRRHGINAAAFTAAVAIFALLTGLNLLRGLAENPERALVAVRSTLPFAILLLLGTVKYPGEMFRDCLRRCVTWVGVALAAIVCARLMLGPQFLMIGGSSLNAAEINDGGRALPAQGAFLLAIGSVIQLSTALRGSGLVRRSVFLTALLFVTVIASGQGTASIAAIAGMIVVLSLERGQAVGLRMLVGSALAVSALLIAIALRNFNPGDWEGILSNGLLENLTRRTGNLGTREMVWQAALTAYQQGPPANQILGWPTGSSPELIVVSRSWGHVIWTNSVHNMYLGTLLNQGGAGLLVFIWGLIAAAYSSSIGLARRQGAAPLAFVVMISIFAYSYGLPLEQALFVVAAAIPGGKLALKPLVGRKEGRPRESGR